MAFLFTHLDAITRPLMLSEIDEHLAAGRMYVSDRLSCEASDILRGAPEGGRVLS